MTYSWSSSKMDSKVVSAGTDKDAMVLAGAESGSAWGGRCQGRWQILPFGGGNRV